MGRRLPTTIACGSAQLCSTSIGLTTQSVSGFVTAVYVSSSARGGRGNRNIAGSVPTMTTSDGGRIWRTHAILPAVPGDSMAGASSCLAAKECLADGTDANGGGRTEAVGSNGSWSLLNTQRAAVRSLGVACTTASMCLRIDEYQGLHGFSAVLLKSPDDGRTWTRLFLPTGSEPAVIGGCQDANTCEVVAVRSVRLLDGELGVPDYSTSTVQLLTTSNGGLAWSTTTLGRGDIPVAASCSSTAQCTVLVQVGSANQNLPDYLVSTQDGHHWTSTPVDPPFGGLGFGPFPGSGVALTCAAPSTCLFADDNGNTSGSALLRSDDGGASWIVTTSPGPRGDEISGATCVTGSTCDLAYSPPNGGVARLVQTTDGGAIWLAPNRIPGSANFGVSVIDCATSSSCTVVLANRGAPSAESTADLGATWSMLGWPSNRAALGFSSTDDLSCSSSTCLVAETSFGFPSLLSGGPFSLQATTQLLRLVP